MRALVVVVVVFAATTALAGPCPPHDPETTLLTPANTQVPADGGIVVATESANRGDANLIAGPFRFHDVNADVEPELHTLAPGLDLYQAPAALGPDLQLAGVRFARQTGKAPALLPAPSVKRVEYVDQTRPNISHLEVRATLAGAAPAEALALVVFGVAKSGTTPRSWTRAASGATTLAVYESPPKCSHDVAGTIISQVGDHVAFAWVDRTGRLSKLSATFTVARGKR